MRSLIPTLLLAACATAPPPEPVAPLDLPDLRLTTVEDWQQVRRPRIQRLFERNVYGRTPEGLGEPWFEVTDNRSDALGGLATRLLVKVTLPEVPGWRGMDVMLYVPNDAPWPVPCFVGLSFRGNHAVSTEPDVPASNENGRGSESSRWPLELILGRGVAVATAWYGDIEPDRPDGFRDGLRGAAPDGSWGAIGAWAFGLRLIADYLEKEVLVDAERLAVIGHSRLGKTALWAGAQDERFDVVVSNNSGEGGAALMRRPVGETTADITRAFPHWFTRRYASYASDPSRCPVDQHMLVALIAPRAVYIGSASNDTWADPEGEFLSGLHASPVWELFGLQGVGVDRWPPSDHPVGSSVGYHVRTGDHDVTDYDWVHYLIFAERRW